MCRPAFGCLWDALPCRMELYPVIILCVIDTPIENTRFTCIGFCDSQHHSKLFCLIECFFVNDLLLGWWCRHAEAALHYL